MTSAPVQSEKEATALLLIDLQPDFFPGGALAVEDGDKIIPGITKLMQSRRFGIQVATQDWHPPDHISFASRHDGKAPFDTKEYHGHEQTLWPDHCVRGTPGAQLHPDLPWIEIGAVIRKGMPSDADSYSGFRNNWNAAGERPNTGLAGYLRDRGITTTFLCGLARDVCVLWSALDSADNGFDTYFLWDLTRAVDPEQDEQTRQTLEDKGIQIINSDALV
mgnify:CR=1 FL=1